MKKYNLSKRKRQVVFLRNLLNRQDAKPTDYASSSARRDSVDMFSFPYYSMLVGVFFYRQDAKESTKIFRVYRAVAKR